MASGRRWVVDMDLEKFFDRVNHDVLMARVGRKVGDKRVLGLIGRYLRAGLMAGGVVTQRTQGTPQGGPLSPLLSNILLDDLDKELERRGHSFCRYADDCNIYVRSRRAWARVLASLTRFLSQRLKLSVNEAKSAVDRPWKRTFLGYSMTYHMKPRLKVAASSVARFKGNLRALFRRGRGRSVARVIEEATPVLRGWTTYFRLLPAGGNEGAVRGPGWMVPAQAQEHPLAAMEPPPDPRAETDAAGDRKGAGLAVHIQRTRPLVERRGQPHEPSLPELLFPNLGADTHDRTAPPP